MTRHVFRPTRPRALTTRRKAAGTVRDEPAPEAQRRRWFGRADERRVRRQRDARVRARHRPYPRRPRASRCRRARDPRPADAVLNATAGSLAGDILNVRPPRFSRSERRAGASDGACLDSTSGSSSVAVGAPSRAATTGSHAGPAPRPQARPRRSVLYMLPALKICWMMMVWWMKWAKITVPSYITVVALLVLIGC